MGAEVPLGLARGGALVAIRTTLESVNGGEPATEGVGVTGGTAVEKGELESY